MHRFLFHRAHGRHGHSVRCNKNMKPEFSRIRGGGSMSPTSICCIDLDMSSTVNGMLWLGVGEEMVVLAFMNNIDEM